MTRRSTGRQPNAPSGPRRWRTRHKVVRMTHPPGRYVPISRATPRKIRRPSNRPENTSHPPRKRARRRTRPWPRTVQGQPRPAMPGRPAMPTPFPCRTGPMPGQTTRQSPLRGRRDHRRLASLKVARSLHRRPGASVKSSTSRGPKARLTRQGAPNRRKEPGRIHEGRWIRRFRRLQTATPECSRKNTAGCRSGEELGERHLSRTSLGRKAHGAVEEQSRIAPEP